MVLTSGNVFIVNSEKELFETLARILELMYYYYSQFDDIKDCIDYIANNIENYKLKSIFANANLSIKQSWIPISDIKIDKKHGTINFKLDYTYDIQFDASTSIALGKIPFNENSHIIHSINIYPDTLEMFSEISSMKLTEHILEKFSSNEYDIFVKLRRLSFFKIYDEIAKKVYTIKFNKPLILRNDELSYKIDYVKNSIANIRLKLKNITISNNKESLIRFKISVDNYATDSTLILRNVSISEIGTKLAEIIETVAEDSDNALLDGFITIRPRLKTNYTSQYIKIKPYYNFENIVIFNTTATYSVKQFRETIFNIHEKLNSILTKELVSTDTDSDTSKSFDIGIKSYRYQDADDTVISNNGFILTILLNNKKGRFLIETRILITLNYAEF